MPPRTRLGPSQALWNPGVSAPSVSLAQESAPAAPISSRTPSTPSHLRHKKSKSLPGGFKLSELEPRTG
ncbi:hypothetical protein BDY24DRAFT_385960, partial [Mrakia frigida]|uniref:uncharacterized protein n=1 Tax=Mrakia frigida TaxID=29902 RepID=UPI003FCC1747